MDILVARYLGIKPEEAPLEDPDEIAATINSWLKS